MSTKAQVSDIRVSWTADHEQYWQGHGIAFTSYTHCATGAGATLREAFEDALDSLAQEDIEVSEEQQAELLTTFENEDMDKSIVEDHCAHSAKYRETHDCDCAVCAGEWHFYVSIDVTVETYRVIVGNIGTVYDGPDFEEATKHYAEYVGQSRLNYGRAAGEPVTLMRNDEPMREHQGTLDAEA